MCYEFITSICLAVLGGVLLFFFIFCCRNKEKENITCPLSLTTSTIQACLKCIEGGRRKTELKKNHLLHVVSFTNCVDSTQEST